MSENPLYTVRTKLTYDEYEKFNMAVWRDRKSAKVLRGLYTIIYIAFAVELLLCIVAAAIFRSAELLGLGLVVIAAAAMLLVFELFQRMIIKNITRRTFKSDKSAMDAEIVTCFYDDHLSEQSESVAARLKYANIYKVIETKTHLYIMQSEVRGYLFKKDECPEGLAEFIVSLGKKSK